MATSSQPCLLSCCHCLKAKSIVQLVGYGAGKTRAAAAIIAGLITVDPSLRIMILTKENVASQVFAEHIIGLSLPTWNERKFGRLVGFIALQNQTTSCTRLDVPTAHRHDALSSKQVIIGCGGRFCYECASRYSPVAQCMRPGPTPSWEGTLKVTLSPPLSPRLR